MVLERFGIVRFHGIIGVLLACILARSMLETRGLAGAWFIHLVQDELVFGFMAIGAITPGEAERQGSPRR